MIKKRVKELKEVDGLVRLYRRNPLRVYAVKLKEDVVVSSPEGDLTGKKGDYLVQGLKGEIYPVKEELFTKTYEQDPDELEDWNHD